MESYGVSKGIDGGGTGFSPEAYLSLATRIIRQFKTETYISYIGRTPNTPRRAPSRALQQPSNHIPTALAASPPPDSKACCLALPLPIPPSPTPILCAT